MLERLKSMTRGMKPSAGLLIHTREAAGRTVVLAGRRTANLKYACLTAIGIRVQDCWSIPYGAMDDQDGGDFRACAVREAAEEVLNGTAYAHTFPVAAGFDKWVGGGFSLVAAAEDSREWRLSRLSPTCVDSRAYAVRLPCIPADVASLDGGGEFVRSDDGLKWRELSWLENQPDLFFGMSALLRFFASELRS